MRQVTRYIPQLLKLPSGKLEYRSDKLCCAINLLPLQKSLKPLFNPKTWQSRQFYRLYHSSASSKCFDYGYPGSGLGTYKSTNSGCSSDEDDNTYSIVEHDDPYSIIARHLRNNNINKARVVAGFFNLKKISQISPSGYLSQSMRYSILVGNLDAVKFLIDEAYANVDMDFKDGTRPIYLAAKLNDYDMVKLLLNRNAQPRYETDILPVDVTTDNRIKNLLNLFDRKIRYHGLIKKLPKTTVLSLKDLRNLDLLPDNGVPDQWVRYTTEHEEEPQRPVHDQPYSPHLWENIKQITFLDNLKKQYWLRKSIGTANFVPNKKLIVLLSDTESMKKQMYSQNEINPLPPYVTKSNASVYHLETLINRIRYKYQIDVYTYHSLIDVYTYTYHSQYICNRLQYNGQYQSKLYVPIIRSPLRHIPIYRYNFLLNAINAMLDEYSVGPNNSIPHIDHTVLILIDDSALHFDEDQDFEKTFNRVSNLSKMGWKFIFCVICHHDRGSGPLGVIYREWSKYCGMTTYMISDLIDFEDTRQKIACSLMNVS